jgi:uncharacterized protein
MDDIGVIHQLHRAHHLFCFKAKGRAYTLFPMRQQKASFAPAMPKLWSDSMRTRCVVMLVILVALGLALVVDAERPPNDQMAARCYLAGIYCYRAVIHPVTERFIRCPFRPSCSRYSEEAVRRFGIARGLKLTIVRLWSCRSSVAPGTLDMVPAG